MTRYLNSFFITMILYLIAVFFLFFLFADSEIIPEKKEEKSISLKHISFVQHTTPQPIQSEPEPILEKSEPEPITEKKIHKPKKERKVEHKKFEHKKTIQEPIKQNNEETKTEPVQQIIKPVTTPIPDEVTPKQVDTNEIENIEAKYLSKLRAEIEKNKVYPSTAKRLNQNGKVYITFTISKNGQITNIKISKSSYFEKLDEAALKILADLGNIEPIPNELNKLNWEITVPIVYQIKQ